MAMRKEIVLAVVFLLLCGIPAAGQVHPVKRIKVKKGLLVILRDTTFITKRDTVIVQNDPEANPIRIRENPYLKSSKFYDSLSKSAYNNRFTREVFDLIVKKRGRKEKLVNAVVKSEEIFIPYAGYTIRSIVFRSVDMLEGSVIDTLQKAETKFGKFVNKVHKDTRSQIISNNLLFEIGDLVDPYQLADNERVLRQFITLRDARIYLTENKDYPKTVDVIVVTQDVTSIGIAGAFSSLTKFRFDMYDINILGYAKQLRLSYFRSAAYSPKNGYEVTLREPNLSGTFLQGELQYTDNYLRQRTRLALGRDFFAPEIKYAGGIELYRTHEKYYFEEYDTLEIPYTENSVDLWAGRSIEFKKRINLIFSSRIDSKMFSSKPFVSSDSNSFFYDRTLLLGSVTLTKRNYLKSLRIRGFGKTEDIPIGGSVSVMLGKESNEFINRKYYEVGGAFSRYFQGIGYLNISLAGGSYFKQGTAQDGLVSASGIYFSDLVKLRKAQLRQFIYLTYMKGFNRVLDQTISLSGKWEDKSGTAPLGNERLTVGFENVYFMPWYIYGFQFALFHRIDFSLLSNGKQLFTRNSLFPIFRVGARMLNENLVLPRFSFDLAYYAGNKNFSPAWEFKVATTLIDLFGTNQVFKPHVLKFN
jgi:hypothetical protein